MELLEWSPEIFGITMAAIVVIAILLVVICNLLGKSRDSQRTQSKYPSRYTCLDGDVVRSLSECLIDNFLYRHGVAHKYEDLILKSAERQFKYDWYLPAGDIYVEFFGRSDKAYLKNSDLKRKFYRRHHLKMVEILPQDLDDLTRSLPPKFGKEWEKMVISKHCPSCGEVLDDRM